MRLSVAVRRQSRGHVRRPIHFGRVCAGAFVIVVGPGPNSFSNSCCIQQWHEYLVHLRRAGQYGISALVAQRRLRRRRRGMKQGLCAGSARVIVIGIQIGSPKFVLESTIFTVSGVVTVALVGGWFGSQLFPPLGAKRKRGLAAYD